MRLIGITLMTAALLLNISALQAQNKGQELQRQADAALEKKEYTQARYFYLQDYAARAEEKKYDAFLIDDGMKTIVKYGIAFYKKNCKVMLG